jgi:P27 family predicted phage terminase small subunit
MKQKSKSLKNTRIGGGSNQHQSKGVSAYPKAAQKQSGPAGKPLAELPAQPERFADDEAATFEWFRSGSVLVSEKRLTPQDLGALEGLCMAWADWLRSEQCVKDEGQLIEGKKNPACSMLVAARSAYLAYLTAFGLTPMARKKLDIEPYVEPAFNCFGD